MNTLESFNKKNMNQALSTREVPIFKAGDTVKISVKISEGQNERIQAFEGVCLRRKNRGIGSSFSVKKISNGQGVEKNFLLYSPKITKIEVTKRGVVRRAKLYYMRSLKGKAARIKEKMDYHLRKPKATSTTS